MSTLKVKASPVYTEINDASEDARVIVLEGGSRSSKTWSIFLHLIIHRNNEGLVITVGREKMTWLRSTLLADLKEITETYNIPITPEINVNRSNQEYTVNGNYFRFMGMDDAQKIHGQKQDIFWVNESVEVSKEDFDQLEMRTSEYGILDYNPAMSDAHWIVSSVLSRPDTVKLHSTMLDNPFLPESIRQKIQSYEPTPENIKAGTADETNWKIYGLGERALQKGLVYDNWKLVKQMPQHGQWKVYGLDFGFSNHPTALVKVILYDGELWADECIYKTGLTNPDISIKLEQHCTKEDTIIADSAEPKSIKEIKGDGWDIKGAEKGPDSVRQGIDAIKRYKLNVTENSSNLIKELRNYKWREDSEGNKDNKPVDAFNHGLDALRYGVSSKTLQPEDFMLWG